MIKYFNVDKRNNIVSNMCEKIYSKKKLPFLSWIKSNSMTLIFPRLVTAMCTISLSKLMSTMLKVI